MLVAKNIEIEMFTEATNIINGQTYYLKTTTNKEAILYSMGILRSLEDEINEFSSVFPSLHKILTTKIKQALEDLEKRLLEIYKEEIKSELLKENKMIGLDWKEGFPDLDNENFESYSKIYLIGEKEDKTHNFYNIAYAKKDSKGVVAFVKFKEDNSEEMIPKTNISFYAQIPCISKIEKYIEHKKLEKYYE